jgi:hypothetical protein
MTPLKKGQTREEDRHRFGDNPVNHLLMEVVFRWIDLRESAR